MLRRNWNGDRKRYRTTIADGPNDLQSKVARSGGAYGTALETDENINTSRVGGAYYEQQQNSSLASNNATAGIYGGRQRGSSSISNCKSRYFRSNSSVARKAASNFPSNSSVTSIRSRNTSLPYRPLPKSSTANVAVHVICAVSENLARETCICSLDAGSPTSVQVTKQGNGQTYAETMAYLEILKPDEILLNEGRRNSQLARKVLELFNPSALLLDQRHPSLNNNQRMVETDENDRENHGTDGRFGEASSTTVVKFISRSYFDQTKGAELLRRVSREETYDQGVVGEYILLSSAHALLQYTQQCLGAIFARKSIYLSINCGGKKQMMIDRSTLLQLEILVNSKTGKIKDSLIGSIDCTKTVVGSRLLRTCLMSPSTRIDTINARLDLVDAFLSDENFFYAVMDHLKNLPEVDRMLSNIALIPQSMTNQGGSAAAVQRKASKGISALVCIKTTLQALPPFAAILRTRLDETDGIEMPPEREDNDNSTLRTDYTSLLVGIGAGDPIKLCHNHLLKAILFAVTQPALREVLDAVENIFTETTAYTRNQNAMRHQECFALKCEDSGMMTVLRKAFLANVDDIYRKADEYAEVHGFQVIVRYSSGRGYYLSVPAEVGTFLHNVFLQPTRSGRYVNCTTEEITSLNSRAQDNVHDLLLMTHDRIHEVLDIARGHYDALASLCDAVALLDMCHSFADNVTLNTLPWCRPRIVEPLQSDFEQNIAPKETNRALMVRNGRYAIEVESRHGSNTHVPNDIYAADGKNLTIITGINGSGKTTYLKQIAIIVILAHSGSYVPAEAASIPIFDRLCCRIGTADDNEHNLSTFMLEMKETAFICNNASDRSLILMDEVGRATSNEDGVAIAWAVSEYLLQRRAMTFFVTHYPQLARMAEIYPAVQNICLEAEITRGDHSEIKYSHKVKSGPCSVSTDYGVEMAAFCGWPDEAVEIARETEKKVEVSLPYNGIYRHALLEQSNSQSKAVEVLKDVFQRLKVIATEKRSNSYDVIRNELSALRSTITEISDQDVHNAIHQILAPVQNIDDQPAMERTEASNPREVANGNNDNDFVDHSFQKSQESDGETTLSSSSASSDDSSSKSLD